MVVGDSILKQIKLTQGKFALVDDADFEWLNQWKWYAKESKVSWYAVRKERKNEFLTRKRRTVRMHNVIMKPADDQIVHHKDGDGENNQRANLQLCTLSENNTHAANKRNGNSE